MTPLTALAIAGAGLAAGTINTIVGSGSLVTFPTLLGLGYPAVVANVSNTVGLFPGSISGALGYRRELAGQRARTVRLSLVGTAGGITGAVLLLALPGSVFRRVVPYLILLACLLIALQPRLTGLVAGRQREGSVPSKSPTLIASVYLTGVYGGYFGAAQGVILIALLAIFIRDDLQRLNAVKNVVTAFVNGVAAVVFMLVAPVAWAAAGLVAVGAIVGGQLGAVLGRRLPPAILRAVIIVVGLIVAIELLVNR